MAQTRILVVDDDPVVRRTVGFVLDEHGLGPVIAAPDGQEAVRVAMRDRPDVVVLDLRMPGMDGIAVCRRIRAQASLAHTRIVLLSAELMGREQRILASIGADEWIRKPIAPSRMVAVVKEQLARAAELRGAEHETPAEPAVTPPAAGAS